MPTLRLFSHILPDAHLTAHQLLECLSSLDHVLYLKNHQQPCIFFDAEEYYFVKNQVIHHYQKQDFNQYSCTPSTHTLLELLAITKRNASVANCCNAGYISYDYAAQQQTKITNKTSPALFVGQFSAALYYSEDGWTFNSSQENAAESYQQLLNLLAQKPSKATAFSLSHPLTARWSKSDYAQAFHQVQDYIQAGDCYQINLTQEFVGQAEGRLLDTASVLWPLTDAPYSGYLRVQDFELLSCSPELFIEFSQDRKIVTQPIKGTTPRYSDPILDAQSKHWLQHSKKDQAENVMIVDLLRNDFSVYAETGSVKTPKLFQIESFKQVHHMVSEVEAILKAEVDPFQVLLSALPGGSITGAPKIRAMQIIEELEAAPRGAYCGSMGYFNADGTGAWNILIRSVQKYQQEVSLSAGGGITIASDCDAEYQECFDKVKAILDVLNTWPKSKEQKSES